ncbi:DUF2188 domain-containing protein [Chitinophagaceae bacterium 26-R-25]|nr:DUF2188 domain-containing protein [Chitinophagaceae bacterium 26-R-25]
MKTTRSNKSVDEIQLVIPLGGTGWMVKASNAKTFTVITDSKAEAITIARNIAQNKHCQMIVHGRSGAIEKTENYRATSTK